MTIGRLSYKTDRDPPAGFEDEIVDEKLCLRFQ